MPLPVSPATAEVKTTWPLALANDSKLLWPIGKPAEDTPSKLSHRRGLKLRSAHRRCKLVGCCHSRRAIIPGSTLPRLPPYPGDNASRHEMIKRITCAIIAVVSMCRRSFCRAVKTSNRTLSRSQLESEKILWIQQLQRLACRTLTGKNSR